MLSSFNSFTRRFTSVFEPVTPVCSLNALAIDAASGSSVVPVEWSLFSGSIPFVNDGIRKYFRFPLSATASAFRFNIANRQINYATNGGMTHIVVVRLNSTNAPPNTSVGSALISQIGVSGFQPITALSTPGVCVF